MKHSTRKRPSLWSVQISLNDSNNVKGDDALRNISVMTGNTNMVDWQTELAKLRDRARAQILGDAGAPTKTSVGYSYLPAGYCLAA